MPRYVTGYVAFDGKFFDTQTDCAAYEARSRIYSAVHTRVHKTNIALSTNLDPVEIAKEVFRFLDINREPILLYYDNTPALPEPETKEPILTVDEPNVVEPTTETEEEVVQPARRRHEVLEDDQTTVIGTTASSDDSDESAAGADTESNDGDTGAKSAATQRERAERYRRPKPRGKNAD